MSSSKRHFTAVIGKKEQGTYVSSSPSSAARKAISKLCADDKKRKVVFSVRETTQNSRKKTYGPYIGYMQKLDKPVELEGRIIRYKPVAKLDRTKYLSQKIKYKQKGGLLPIVEIIKKHGILFGFNPSYKIYGEFLLELIESELISRNVTTLLATGTTKFVYNTLDEQFVVKVVIIDESIFDRMIKEPIEMMNNEYCNTPINIVVFSTNNKIIDNVLNINQDVGTYCVIIWTEEKATKTGLENFPSEVMVEANKWYETTRQKLEKKQFTDLGKVNVGYFRTEPHFRWIDIQPME